MDELRLHCQELSVRFYRLLGCAHRLLSPTLTSKGAAMPTERFRKAEQTMRSLRCPLAAEVHLLTGPTHGWPAFREPAQLGSQVFGRLHATSPELETPLHAPLRLLPSTKLLQGE